MTFYSVVRYMPDPITEEQVNIGLIAIDEDGVQCRFAGRLGRAKALNARRMDVVYDAIKHLQKTCSIGTQEPFEDLALGHRAGLNLDRLRALAIEDRGFIRFSDPKPSLDTARQVIDHLFEVFVKEPGAPKIRGYRNFVSANTLGVESMQKAVEKLKLKDHEVLRYPIVQGELETHTLGFGLKNGILKVAGIGLSFEISAESLAEDIERLLWRLSDLSRARSGVKLAVMRIGALHLHRPQAKRLALLCDNMNVVLVNEFGAERWATKTVKTVAFAAGQTPMPLHEVEPAPALEIRTVDTIKKLPPKIC